MMGRSKFKAAVSAMLLVIGSFAGYAGYLQLTGNFHTVLAGELYRSAQPSSTQLERYVRDHGIKTVINLRGESNRDWYSDEVRTTDELGVKHINFRMTASKRLDPDRASALLALMKRARKPILIHCLSGSDRTGLVAALYSFWIAHKDESFSERQLSFYYGHVGIPLVSAAWAMDQSWERLEDPPPERPELASAN